jgi:predicted alpha/beta superfamily hydrolase
MNLAPDFLVFAFSFLGFSALSASMNRHALQLFGALPGKAVRWRRAVTGWAALILSLVPAVHAHGLSNGIAVWLGFHALSATTVGLVLAYRPGFLRFVVPAAAAGALLLSFAFPARAQPDLRVEADVSLLSGDSAYAFLSFDEARNDTLEAPNYRIYLAIPKKAPPREGYPILYLLDGNAVLDTLGGYPELLDMSGTSDAPPVLVMIGYETPARFAPGARAYDYTPPIPGQPDLEESPGSGRKAGGAERFREFIVERLKPEVERRLGERGLYIDPSRQGLWGHSYGGLFALYVLFTHPGDFREYHAISPSFGWREGWILREAEALPAQLLPQVTLLAMAGADEIGEKRKRNPDYPGTASPQRASGENLRRLVEDIRARTGCRAQAIPVAGKGHSEMFAIGLEATLRALSGFSAGARDRPA